MSGRSRDASRLEQRLGADAGIAVEVRWDQSAASARKPGRWAWHVMWSDGPTVETMRATVEGAARELHSIDAAQLVLQRIVQPRSFALAMLRNVRSGQPAYGAHASQWRMRDALDCAAYPERGSDDELALVERLGRLAQWDEGRMAELLDGHGLAVLTGELKYNNVVPLRPPE